jgi:protein-S-isoprenylcysteine O-methyltransferase Ste14
MLKIIPPFWMFIFLTIAGAVSAVVSFPRFALMPLGIALAALGVGISFWGFGLFAREGTEIAPTSETNKLLVESGPYRFTRNPMYLGLVLFSLGIAFWTGLLPFFAVPVIVFAITNWVHIPFEEEKMHRQYGALYDAYRARVRRWI